MAGMPRSQDKSVLAWHFVGDTLRDGRPVPADGEILEYSGPLVMCETGLHASRRIIDALKYAPGHTICRVRLWGAEAQGHSDKLVGNARKILWRVDGQRLLRTFACDCALDVAHLWDMPPIVQDFLETQDETRRVAASAAAWAARAASYAARVAAWYAASAAGDAAGDAARAAQNKRLTAMAMEAHKEQRR